ncbi:hypothetical protein [Candidatus Poriferisocius sp.]|uniref:hypothetical protein n=1 Tax=Candidatus Poriferisocius sp. TaxID=3101276 RepID=UPI003B01BC57
MSSRADPSHDGFAAAVELDLEPERLSSRAGPSHWTWRSGPIKGGPAVIVDVDGVISDAGHRQHLARDRRWNEFFDGCPQDPPLEVSIALVRSLAPDIAVVLLTARPWRLLPGTVAWLDTHRVRWDLLVLRPPNHAGSSRDYKATEVENLRHHGFNLLYALEDDPRNVKMYTEAAVPCLYIHSGYYDSTN